MGAISSTGRMMRRAVSLVLVASLTLFISGGVYAADLDLSGMLNTLTGNLGPVIILIRAIAIVIGLWFMISGTKDLKALGQAQTGTAEHLGGPLARIILGTALIFFQGSIDVVSATFGLQEVSSSSNWASYTKTGIGLTKQITQGMLLLFKAIGLITFIRGFISLNHATQPNAQSGMVGKGIIYIIGGVLLINVQATLTIISNSLGITLSLG